MESYDAGPTDTPILEQTIGENFERTVRANPDVEALVDMASTRRWTYRELNDEIDVIARGLMSLGIERGDRVGIGRDDAERQPQTWNELVARRPGAWRREPC